MVFQIALTGVNGCDFWHYPGQRADQMVGTIEASLPRILSTEPPTWRIEDGLAAQGWHTSVGRATGLVSED